MNENSLSNEAGFFQGDALQFASRSATDGVHIHHRIVLQKSLVNVPVLLHGGGWGVGGYTWDRLV